MSDSTRHGRDREHVQPEPLPPTGSGAGKRSGRARVRIADVIDAVGERIEDRGHAMRGRGGARRQAGQAAIRAGHVVEAGAEYLREHEVDEMKREVETRVRQRPFAAIAIAAAAGFLIARIVR